MEPGRRIRLFTSALLLTTACSGPITNLASPENSSGLTAISSLKQSDFDTLTPAQQRLFVSFLQELVDPSTRFLEPTPQPGDISVTPVNAPEINFLPTPVPTRTIPTPAVDAVSSDPMYEATPAAERFEVTPETPAIFADKNPSVIQEYLDGIVGQEIGGEFLRALADTNAALDSFEQQVRPPPKDDGSSSEGGATNAAYFFVKYENNLVPKRRRLHLFFLFPDFSLRIMLAPIFDLSGKQSGKTADIKITPVYEVDSGENLLDPAARTNEVEASVHLPIIALMYAFPTGERDRELTLRINSDGLTSDFAFAIHLGLLGSLVDQGYRVSATNLPSDAGYSSEITARPSD